MDDPALEASEHARALRGLARLNRAARSARILWPALLAEGCAAGSRPLRVLDIATGSGDVPIALARRARRAGRMMEIDGCDISHRAVELAGGRAERAGVSGASFIALDVLHDELPAGYDVLMCSLFMHHLGEAQATELLYRMRCAAGRLVLVSDLERCAAGLALAWAASRVLTRSHVVHTDAVRSVRGAFTMEEFEGLSVAAGLEGASLDRRWPWRFLLQWRKA